MGHEIAAFKIIIYRDITHNLSVQARVTDIVQDKLSHPPIKCMEFHQSIFTYFRQLTG